MSVDIAGTRKLLPHAFTMPGKLDSEGNPLVFVRGRNGKVRVPTGPSVYQLFRIAADSIQGAVYADFGERVAAAVQLAFEKELA